MYTALSTTYFRAALTMTLALVLLPGAPSCLRAQVMEPLSYTNAPIGLNFLIMGYGYLSGDVLLDPSLPIDDLNAKAHTTVFTYARVLDFWGQSGTLALVVPYAWLSASGKVAGQARSVDRSGLADVAMRASINLYGAPAVSLQDFAKYRQDTIVGVSLLVTAPTGQYDPARLINLGTNRWSFRPEVGASKGFGRWTVEVAVGAAFYTDNDEFLGSNVRKQDPLYGVQGHLLYNFSPRMWAALDATYYTGGRTSLNGVASNDLQKNSRWGATLARTLDKNNSIKLYFSSGVTARTGTNFNVGGIAWQYRWGAGL